MYTKMEILTDSENGKKNWEICQKYNGFKFERASFRSNGGRGVDRLLVIGSRDALVT